MFWAWFWAAFKGAFVAVVAVGVLLLAVGLLMGCGDTVTRIVTPGEHRCAGKIAQSWPEGQDGLAETIASQCGVEAEGKVETVDGDYGWNRIG